MIYILYALIAIGLLTLLWFCLIGDKQLKAKMLKVQKLEAENRKNLKRIRAKLREGYH